jgi:hypothetical protein
MNLIQIRLKNQEESFRRALLTRTLADASKHNAAARLTAAMGFGRIDNPKGMRGSHRGNATYARNEGLRNRPIAQNFLTLEKINKRNAVYVGGKAFSKQSLRKFLKHNPEATNPYTRRPFPRWVHDDYGTWLEPRLIKAAFKFALFAMRDHKLTHAQVMQNVTSDFTAGYSAVAPRSFPNSILLQREGKAAMMVTVEHSPSSRTTTPVKLSLFLLDYPHLKMYAVSHVPNTETGFLSSNGTGLIEKTENFLQGTGNPLVSTRSLLFRKKTRQFHDTWISAFKSLQQDMIQLLNNRE